VLSIWNGGQVVVKKSLPEPIVSDHPYAAAALVRPHSNTRKRVTAMTRYQNESLNFDFGYSFKNPNNRDCSVTYRCGSDDQVFNGPGPDEFTVWFRSEDGRIDAALALLRRWAHVGFSAFRETDAEAAERWHWMHDGREHGAGYLHGRRIIVIGGDVPDYVRSGKEYMTQFDSNWQTVDGETVEESLRTLRADGLIERVHRNGRKVYVATEPARALETASAGAADRDVWAHVPREIGRDS
jgi:hypothetical protein